jgi:hypothetical protein
VLLPMATGRTWRRVLSATVDSKTRISQPR